MIGREIETILENLSRKPSAFSGQAFYVDPYQEEENANLWATDSKQGYAYVRYIETSSSLSATRKTGCGDYRISTNLRLVAVLPCPFTDPLIGAVLSRLLEYPDATATRIIHDSKRLYYEETGGELPGKWYAVGIDFQVTNTIIMANCAGDPCCDCN